MKPFQVFSFARQQLEAMFLASSHVTWLASRLLTLKLVAVFMGIEAVGELAIILATAAGVQILFFGPIQSWALRHYQLSVQSGSMRKYSRLLTRTTAFMSCLVGAVAILFWIIFDGKDIPVSGLSASHVSLGLGLGVIIGLSDLSTGIINAAIRQWMSGVLIASHSVVSLLVTYLLVRDEHTSVLLVGTGILLSAATISILATLLAVRVVKRSIPEYSCGLEQNSEHLQWRNFVDYTWPFFVWGIAGYAISFGDRWILAIHTDSVSLGVYVAMFTASIGLVNAFHSSITRAIEPKIYRMAGETTVSEYESERAHVLIHQTGIAFLSLYTLAAVAFMLIPDSIIRLVSSDEFIGESHLLWALFLAGAMFVLSQHLIIRGLVQQNSRMYLHPKLFHGVLLIVLFWLLTPEFGISGVVYSLLLANSAQAVAILLINHLYLRSTPLRVRDRTHGKRLM